MESAAVEWLRNRYCSKKSFNRNYSLRAFARDLEIPPGAMSEIMSGARPLTPKQGEKIAFNLSSSEEEKKEFLSLIKNDKSRIGKVVRQGAKSVNYKFLNEDEFFAISEPYHFYLLSLIKTENFRSDPMWVAKRLGLSTTEVRSALGRLERLGLVKKSGNTIIRTKKRFATTSDIPSKALRNSHKKTLQEIIDSVDDVPVELRDISSMTLGINLNKLPEAKKLIKDFRRGLAELLEEGDQQEVYNLNIQLMPVTKGGD